MTNDQYYFARTLLFAYTDSEGALTKPDAMVVEECQDKLRVHYDDADIAFTPGHLKAILGHAGWHSQGAAQQSTDTVAREVARQRSQILKNSRTLEMLAQLLEKQDQHLLKHDRVLERHVVAMNDLRTDAAFPKLRVDG